MPPLPTYDRNSRTPLVLIKNLIGKCNCNPSVTACNSFLLTPMHVIKVYNLYSTCKSKKSINMKSKYVKLFIAFNPFFWTGGKPDPVPAPVLLHPAVQRGGLRWREQLLHVRLRLPGRLPLPVHRQRGVHQRRPWRGPAQVWPGLGGPAARPLRPAGDAARPTCCRRAGGPAAGQWMIDWLIII